MSDELQQPVTEYKAAKAMIDAAVYLASAMGFVVKAEFESEIGKPAHMPTVMEALKDLMWRQTQVMVGYKINPRSLVTSAPKAAASQIILPYDGNS